MKILFIGDIFGNKGLEAVTNELAGLKEQYEIDFTIANAENTTNGKSLSMEHYEILSKAGVQFFTFGNHT
jgi:calcineurin-like phosphoesterase